jgi:hypothetical protein
MPAASAPVRYFAPQFFSPFYFPPLLPLDYGTVVADPKSTYRDRDALAAVAAALEGSGEFAAVFIAASADRRPGGADLTPVIVVTPNSWDETDDADPSVIVRQLAFSLTVVVRDDDPASGFDSLDRLSCIALNAVNGSDLGQGCLPALTRLRRGVFEPDAVYPELRVVLRGELTYLIPSPNGHCDSH